MSSRQAPAPLPPAQAVAERVFSAFDRFLHVESVSGIVLLVTTVIALVWANSPAAHSYHALWETSVTLGFGSWQYSQSLHFLINDALMAVFFLVVGMEIRREIFEGALSDVRSAALPLAAALGGVAVPAMIYLAFNQAPDVQRGWAVPTATDIAFAVGVLALLGRSIPSSIRILLLALAIIDDIVAVLIIALFYSGGIDVAGLLPAALGILMVLGLQQIGIGSAWAYVLPGAILWLGLLQTGVHPTLAGVVLGMMTPVVPIRTREQPVELADRALGDIRTRAGAQGLDPRDLLMPLRDLRLAQRELLPPVVRVQMALHPWVAFVIMPLFALANAGVSLGGGGFEAPAAGGVMLGIAVALIVGKPVGVLAGSWIAVKLGWCQLPTGVTWRGVSVVGFLAGIGFTMSIFIAGLAFEDAQLLSAAKIGVLVASLCSGLIGLAWGWLYARHGARGHAGARLPG